MWCFSAQKGAIHPWNSTEIGSVNRYQLAYPGESSANILAYQPPTKLIAYFLKQSVGTTFQGYILLKHLPSWSISPLTINENYNKNEFAVKQDFFVRSLTEDIRLHYEFGDLIG